MKNFSYGAKGGTSTGIASGLYLNTRTRLLRPLSKRPTEDWTHALNKRITVTDALKDRQVRVIPEVVG